MLIEKARQRLAREEGTVFSPLEGRLKFALAFPGVYSLGMSALGWQLIYAILNSLPGVACERVFFPDPVDEQEFQRSHTRLFSLESQSDIADFDVLAFSISYELDYAAVARMIDLAGLPVFSSERDDSHPLIIAGGPCATFNPEPLAEIIDVFAIGDGEDLAKELAEAIRDSQGLDRDELLEKLAQIPGVYVPRFYTPSYNTDGTMKEISPSKRVVKRLTKDLESHNNLACILSPEAEFSDMLLAEVMRGCKRQCRFCVSGYTCLPPRPRPLNNLPDGKRVGLIGSAVFDHPEPETMCAKLKEFSVSSTRIESLTPKLAQMMYQAGQRTMTIAPEAGTLRLRRIINKPTTDDEIMEAARMTAEAGFPRAKLYFMIGLPGETMEDVEGIAEIAKKMAYSNPTLKLQVSASCFVPKPWTPFQWCAITPEQALKERLSRIKRSFAAERRIELSAESPRKAYVQAWLATGDRRLGKVIAAAASNGFNYAQAASELGVDTAFYAERERGKDEIFPWDCIDLMVGKDYLWKEYERAQSGQITTSCNVESCTRCGVCG